MSVLSDLDARLTEAVHKVVSDVASNEPTIDVAVMSALRDLGAPPAVTDSVQALVRGLLAHFSDLAAKQAEAIVVPAEPAAEAVPDGQG